MKSYSKYITKCLASFIAFVILLALINIVSFGWTFHKAISGNYGTTSPTSMLKQVAAASSSKSISNDMVQKLRHNKIWAIFINESGKLNWSVTPPEGLPSSFTLQDVSVFTKGYLQDYPVFTQTADDGLIVLGYPKNSFAKLMSNYYDINTVKKLPMYCTIMLITDFLLLFFAYYWSRQRIIKNTGPIINAIEALSNNRELPLSVSGELSDVANSLNKVSQVLGRQNEARSNWISGVSHDIRTPLSIIMGYADRISSDTQTDGKVRGEAEIIKMQSGKIKDLVQDLNLVSQLEYEMQPLKKGNLRLSKLLRSYVAELLNTGVSESYPVGIEISPQAEPVAIDCDPRLIYRAVSNLVQNSMNHNPKGCHIKVMLCCVKDVLRLAVCDNGIGLSDEKLQELKERPHYMNSMDERLDLRHGLGLLLVRQIMDAHGGTMEIENDVHGGCTTTLSFPM